MNINNENTSFLKEYNKPPLGASPYWFCIQNRIAELGEAILRYNADGITIHVDSIRQWAKEILAYCDLIERIKKENLKQE